jgi:hypothetical protein
MKKKKKKKFRLRQSSMEKRPSGGDSQEIPCNLWNPKFQQRVHKSPSLVRILRQITSVYVPIQLTENPFQYYSPIYA